jgi:hypothetical protein
MRTILRVVGVLLAIAGMVWFLQGISLLPGSFMTGRTEWAVYGVTAFALGLAFFLLANRGRTDRHVPEERR